MGGERSSSSIVFLRGRSKNFNTSVSRCVGDDIFIHSLFGDGSRAFLLDSVFTVRTRVIRVIIVVSSFLAAGLPTIRIKGAATSSSNVIRHIRGLLDRENYKFL